MDVNNHNFEPHLLFSHHPSEPKTRDRLASVPYIRQYPHLSDQVLQEEVKNEQLKNEAIKKEEDKQILDDLVRKSNRCIINISSLFPWDFFANTIIVEESRVTFIFRQFLSSQSHSIDIKDISNVFIQSSLFFATLQIVSRTYVQNDIKIGHLNVASARKVHRVIEGLRTFAAHDIDTSNYGVEELIRKVEELHNINSFDGR